MKNGKAGRRRNAAHVANSKSRYRKGKGINSRSLKHAFQSGEGNIDYITEITWKL